MISHALFLATIAAVPCLAASVPSKFCKVIPGDAEWPSSSDWRRLNSTVNGRLIQTEQVGQVCHVPNYNEEACDALREKWDFADPHIEVPGDFLATWFTNGSCDPHSPTSKPCELGNYVSYSINVTGADDVLAGFKFSRDHNVRLVVHNTGHDYSGKSTGKGALALWTYNLKSVSILDDYKSGSYRGPAIKMGAGVTAALAYTAAQEKGYRVVGGTCASVGLAGGYSQGGGHSVLSGLHGLGADQVLEWEIVTPDGRHLIASKEQNTDLYWAVSGGGPGTFGVVLSMTSKLHLETPIAAGFLNFDASQVGLEKFWDATEFFLSQIPSLLADGSSFLFTVTDSTLGGMYTTFNKTEADVINKLKTLTDGLTLRGVPYTLPTMASDSYFNYFNAMFGPLPFGPFMTSQLIASRLIPKSAVAPANVGTLSSAFRNVTSSKDFNLGCIGTMPTHEAAGNKPSDNAVLPAWRDSVAVCVFNSYWDYTVPKAEMERKQAALTKTLVPTLERATPGGGSYLNEGNFEQPHWQREFYGKNYARLSHIKRSVDPEGLLYALTAVGSEQWTRDSEGRLCHRTCARR